jgi:TATA-binding protein-associated factor
MTATPLQTSTKVGSPFLFFQLSTLIPFQDISAMGRLTGVPHFFTEDAHQEEKNDAANLRRAKKELSDDYDPINDDDDDPIKLCQVSIAQRMQAQFQGRIIRRTIDSKDWEGRLLLNLPPYKAIHVILNLTEREMAVISAKAEAVKDE